MKKYLIPLVIFLIGYIGWWGYQKYFHSSAQNDMVSILPNDAIFFLKTNNLTDAWEEVSKTKIWQQLINTKDFEYLQPIDTLLNKSLSNNQIAEVIFDNRPTLMAAFMTTPNDYDFVYIIDLQSSTFIKEVLDKILKLKKSYKVVKINYKNQNIIKVIDKKKNENLIYISSVNNLLLVSFKQQLIKKIIDEKDKIHWQNRTDFKQINRKLDNGLIQLFFNYKQLPAFTNIYFKDFNKEAQSFARELKLSGWDISQDDHLIEMAGYTLTDTIPSYINALLDVKPGKIKSYEIIPTQAALVVSLSFKNFNLFYQSFINQYESVSNQNREEYRKNIKKLNKYLKIDLQKDLFDWIGQEITLVKLRKSDPQKPEAVVLIIAANDIEEAQKGWAHITQQIRKRTPFKFKTYKYKNFDIHYLHHKNFFKTIFGNLFKKIDKPFYTFIENYVVFSNSEKELKNFINDYITGQTLSHDNTFVNFHDKMDSKSNINILIQMPKLFDLIQNSLSSEGKKLFLEKKNLLLSMNLIGFQLISKDDIFKTLLLIDHDEKAIEKDRLEKLTLKTDNSIHHQFFEDLEFKIFFPDSMQITDGKHKLKYSKTNTIKAEGTVKNQLPVGIWRTYYPSGNLQSVISYNEDGEVDGELFYYFDKKPLAKMAEMTFDDDILSGLYIEYWKNGAQKAKLKYKNGHLHGDAFYYNQAGQIKIKGKYKKSVKKGKWLFYDEKGNIINKKHYSRSIF